MELKGQQGSSVYNPIFRESSETLDPPPPPPPHRLQQNQSTIAQGERIDQISSRSSLKTDALPESMTTSGVRYRECLKNHAASVGGNVLDGCGEFMVSGDEGTPESLKCAACNCHRNFHRKEVHGGDTDFQRSTMVHPLHLPLPSPAPPPPLQSPSLKHHHHHQRINHWTPMVPPVKLSFGGTDSSSEDLDFNGFNSNAAAPPPAPPPPPPFVLSKKRFRTKFTEEQKKGMMEFAEKVGWRIPKEDDEELQRFCREVGVKRQVLKVWMHNNKNFTKKQPQQQQLQQQESS